MHKNYILDANILLHDPNSIFQFDDNTVIIPVSVISEIDRFKKEQTARGYAARAVVRLLDGLRGEHNLVEGVALKSGGLLRVHCDPERGLADMNGHADLEILRVAQSVRRVEPQTPVIIVTKDISLRIRADAAGLRAEDYESDQVRLTELHPIDEEKSIAVEQFERFQSAGDLPLSNGLKLAPNEYVLLRPEDGSRQTSLARADQSGRRLQALHRADDGLWGIRPRNKEQYYAVDALLDESITLVTLMGKAGTGKTLFALAAGMHLAFRRRKYRSILVCRPTLPVGRDLGFLPGGIEQKLEPWMRPIVDTLEFLLDAGGTVKGHSDAADLMAGGLVEIQPLQYIRGRSITGRFVIIDESQNLTPLEVKTVITRIGQGAKIVLTGDPWQIDNPYVDANSNGFTYLLDRFHAQPIAAHVELRKGERSPLAELAANLL